MTIDSVAEIVRFQQFVAEQLNRGTDLSPEEALDLWRAENPRADDMEDDVRAVRAALADMDRGVPLEEFDRAFRRRHGLSAP
jgi:hypothetical protein